MPADAQASNITTVVQLAKVLRANRFWRLTGGYDKNRSSFSERISAFTVLQAEVSDNACDSLILEVGYDVIGRTSWEMTVDSITNMAVTRNGSRIEVKALRLNKQKLRGGGTFDRHHETTAAIFVNSELDAAWQQAEAERREVEAAHRTSEGEHQRDKAVSQHGLKMALLSLQTQEVANREAALAELADRCTELLVGKVVASVTVATGKYLRINFTDGTSIEHYIESDGYEQLNISRAGAQIL